MKVLAQGKLGGDGGLYGVVVEEGVLKLELGLPVSKVLEPVKVHVVDAVKAILPDWGDALVDGFWQSLVKKVSE